MNDIAQLGLRIDSLEAKVAAANLDTLASSSKNAETSALLLEKSFAKLAIVLGPAVLAGAFANSISNAIKLQDSYVRLSEVAGTTASMFSSFDLSARLAGVSLDSVATSVAKLGRSIGEARLGDVQKQGLFRALGIDPKDGRDSAEVMVDLAKKLTNMKDQTVAGAVSTTLLSRGFAELRPFLKEVTEQGTLYKRGTDEQFAAAKKFEDELTKLNFQLETSKIKLSQDLLPELTKIAVAFNEAYTKGGLFQGVLAALAQATTGDDLRKANGEIRAASDSINYLQGKIDEFSKKSSYKQAQDESWLNMLFGGTSQAEFKKRLDEAKQRLAEAQRYKAMLENPSAVNQGTAGPKAPEAPKGESEAERQIRKLMEDQRLYDQRIAAAKGFADQFSDMIKTQNTLAQEAHKQGLISDEELIKQLGENEDMRLQILERSLEKQRALSAGQGKTGKAEEFKQSAAQANAAILANQVITDAKMTSLREVQDLEYKRSVELRMAAIQEGNLTEMQLIDAQLAEKTNVLEIWRGQNADREQEYWIQIANIYAEYENKKSAMLDAEEAKRWGVSQIYRELNMDSAKSFFGGMAQLMQVKSREMFEIGKIAAIAETTINTYKAAMGAYAAMVNIPFVGPALAVAAAGAAIAFGLAQVAAINSQSYGSKGGGAVGTFSASPTTGLPVSQASSQPAQRPDTIIHLHGDSFSADSLRMLVDGLNENAENGGRLIIA